MSGGSWNYVYAQVQDVVDRLLHETKANRRALGRMLEKVPDALKDIEWVDSCDYGKGDEDEAIADALGENAKALILREEVAAAREVLGKLQAALDSVEPKPVPVEVHQTLPNGDVFICWEGSR